MFRNIFFITLRHLNLSKNEANFVFYDFYFTLIFMNVNAVIAQQNALQMFSFNLEE